MTQKKFRRGILIGIATVILLFIGGWFYWQHYKYRLVNNKLSSFVYKKTNGLYRISYGDIKIDELTGRFEIDQLDIIPDSVQFAALNKTSPVSTLIRHIHADRVLISGVNIPLLVAEKKLSAKKVELNSPDINIALNNYLKDTSGYDPSKPLSKQLLGNLVSISADSITVTNANLTVSEMKTRATTFDGDSVSAVLNDFLIDSTTDIKRTLFSRRASFMCAGIVLPSKDGKYKFGFRDIFFTSQPASISLGQFRIMPQLGEAAFAKAIGVQKDRYDFAIRGMRITGLQLASLWRKQILADSLFIREANIHIFHDRSYPPEKNHHPKFIQQQVMQVPLPFRIEHVVFEHAYIEYKEKNPKTDSSGRVIFADASATMTNVNNLALREKAENTWTINFRAKFLNRVPLQTTLAMHVGNPAGKFTIEGTMGSMDAPLLNPLIEPLGLAKVEKGHIESLHFNLQATTAGMDGNLTLRYNDLSLTLLNKDEDENKYKKRKLPTLISNFIIKNENPRKNGELYTANIHYKRAPDKSMFNLIWKSIFDGVKSTAGM